MNSFNPNYFIHAANVLLVVAYSVRDILWLRLFAVAAALISIPYFVLQPTKLWAPLSWTVVFAAINLVQSWRLFIERRPVKLTPEEEDIRRLVFRDLPSRKVLQVLSIGSWTTLQVGERLIESRKRPETVSLIVRGKVRVTRDGRVLGELIAGDVVGYASVRLLPNLLFRQVKPLEVVSHCEVGLKPLIAAVELLFQCGTEDNRNIR